VTVKTGFQECGTEYGTEQNAEWRIKVKFLFNVEHHRAAFMK